MQNSVDARKECCKPKENEKEQTNCTCGCDCTDRNNPAESKSSCC